MRNLKTEWYALNKWLGIDYMSVMFRNFKGYKSVREGCTYIELVNELEELEQLNPYKTY